MKPDPDVSGVPYNFDALPIWLFPSLWDETKTVRLRGLWFVLLYTLSFLVFGALLMFPLAIILSRPINAATGVWIVLCIPSGVVIGLFSWRDFAKKHKKLQAEGIQQYQNEPKNELITTRFKKSLVWRWLWLMFCVFLAFIFVMSFSQRNSTKEQSTETKNGDTINKIFNSERAIPNQYFWQ
ncbi:MAG: hypothetical protein WC825_12320 [Gallionellaceae bacterium]|jgi:hypothetical protein